MSKDDYGGLIVQITESTPVVVSFGDKKIKIFPFYERDDFTKKKFRKIRLVGDKEILIDITKKKNAQQKDQNC